MSIDVTFHPLQPTVVVVTTAAQAVAPSVGNAGVSSFRVYNSATGAFVLGWGTTAANATAAAAAGVALTPGNWVTINTATACYLELPAATWFCGGTGATGFQVTPGFGGVGG
jgi:hypothetical protein